MDRNIVDRQSMESNNREHLSAEVWKSAKDLRTPSTNLADRPSEHSPGRHDSANAGALDHLPHLDLIAKSDRKEGKKPSHHDHEQHASTTNAARRDEFKPVPTRGNGQSRTELTDEDGSTRRQTDSAQLPVSTTNILKRDEFEKIPADKMRRSRLESSDD